MNAHAPIAAEAVADTDQTPLIIEPKTALQVLTDPAEFDAFYARVKAETDKLIPDVSTAKGRDEIRATAMKVVKSKTAIDKAGLALTAEWRANTDKVNTSRSSIKERLDALRDEVRKPLTEWEAAEEARETAVKATLAELQSAAVVRIEDTVATVHARLEQVIAVEIDDERFQEYAAAARSHQETTTATLQAAVARLTKEASDRAELARLQAAEAERLARQESERLAAEAKALEEAEAEARADAEAERRRGEDERAAQAKADEEARTARDREEREAATAKAAADAQAETERKAAEALAAQEAAHRAEVARLENEAQARIDEAARLEREREAEAKRIADAAEVERLANERRSRDREHRGQIMGEAKAALIEIGGIKEEAAKKIVLAIVAGEIPHVALSF